MKWDLILLQSKPDYSLEWIINEYYKDRFVNYVPEGIQEKTNQCVFETTTNYSFNESKGFFATGFKYKMLLLLYSLWQHPLRTD